MLRRIAILGSLAFLPMGAAAAVAQQPPPGLVVRAETFQPTGAAPVEAELGEFLVSANRARAGSPLIPLRFIRFKSRNPRPGPPIVYLAGGPGGSGTGAAAGPRWVLFDLLRDLADVIAFDQRGTGRSHTPPSCRSSVAIAPGLPTTRANFVAKYAEAVTECRRFWEKEGVDLAGYHTNESAADLDDLRRALGAAQLDLWGISYGTHLGLAALKRFPASFRRAVFLGLEGLDQTVKRPAHADAFWSRVQASIDQDTAAKAVYPDVAGLIRRVLARTAAEPVKVTVTTPAGPAELSLGDFELRLQSGGVADPSATAALLARYRQADQGDFVAFARQSQRASGQPFRIEAMPLAMDIASGISPAARRQFEEEAARSVLGDAHNWPMPHLADLMGDLDLGESFRAPFRSAHPVLFFSGTLDGRTFPEAARAVATNFSDVAMITVENGGHNTVMVWPEAQALIKRFLAGEAIQSQTIVMPRPRWVP